MSKVKLKLILEKLLKDKGISARELSRRTGIPQSTINNFLSGRGSHKPEQILTLSKYFGTTMEYLLFGEDTRQPSLDDVLTEDIFDGWIKIRIEKAVKNRRKASL